MSSPVILKSNRYGINLVLDDEIPFDELKEGILLKFREAEKFFKNSDIVISFEGRNLSKEEESTIIDLITQNTTINIACIADNDPQKELFFKKKLDQHQTQSIPNSGEFYKGTLRSGQVLSCESSIVIVGDVNPGAKIIASGNIVIIGSLKGNAFAGAKGDESCFVMALDMDPVQVQIATIIGRSADRGPFEAIRNRRHALDPQMAFVSDGNILMEPISKNLLNRL